jgi:hypothetical protein
MDMNLIVFITFFIIFLNFIFKKIEPKIFFSILFIIFSILFIFFPRKKKIKFLLNNINSKQYETNIFIENTSDFFDYNFDLNQNNVIIQQPYNFIQEKNIQLRDYNKYTNITITQLTDDDTKTFINIEFKDYLPFKFNDKDILEIQINLINDQIKVEKVILNDININFSLKYSTRTI